MSRSPAVIFLAAAACAAFLRAESASPEPAPRVERWLARAESGVSAARAWAHDHASLAAVERRAAQLEAAAREGWRRGVDIAAADYAGTLGVFVLAGPDPARREAPPEWRPLASSGPVPEELVLLVHGLDDPGTIWADAAPAIRSMGFAVVKFDYPNDQAIARSADLLFCALADLHVAGARRIDIVGHSMGGLVARDVLTRTTCYNSRARGHDDLPDIERLVMLGTPNQGSPLAPLRPVMEAREQLVRWAGSDSKDPRLLLGFLVDGDGQAGIDLRPGSEFLRELNARPCPEGVRITQVEGSFTGPGKSAVRAVFGSSVAARVLGAPRAESASGAITGWLDALGDGAVPTSCAKLEGVCDVVCVEADHRSMICRLDLLERALALIGHGHAAPPAVAVILERLHEPSPSR